MQKLRVAMVGNPNVGKTAILNALTKGNFQVGNFPGTTVEKKEGKATINGVFVEFIDLPGIYSLKAYSVDEEVSKKFLFEGDYDLILNVIDASNLERNLYLTLQLCSTGSPMVIALNMIDEAKKRGIEVNSKKLSEILGVPVIETVAVKGEGMGKLKNAIFNPKVCKTSAKTRDEAIKLAEDISKKVLIKKYRFVYLDELDEVFTDPVVGMLIFISAMWMLFKFTYQVASPLVRIIEIGIDLAVKTVGSENVFYSLLSGGIIKGVGSVLVFVPNIAFLFMGLAFMELSGYMARAVFLMDGIMNRLKLNGRAAIPLIMGFGCNVPAVLTTRGIEDRNVRLATVLSIPFISCSARLPVYVLMAGLFFPKNGGEVIMVIYLLSVVFSLITAYLLRSLIFKGDSDFVMELPPYRFPNFRDVVLTTWNGLKHFLEKAGTIILLMSVVLWIITNYPNRADSYAFFIGNAIKPLFSPMGWGGEVSVALLTGLIAKEVIVETISVTTQNLHALLNPAQAFALMVFILLYMPCTATMAVIKSETNSWRWVVFSAVYSFSIAYITALAAMHLIYLLGLS
jgi:ferrous iron transport protein B